MTIKRITIDVTATEATLTNSTGHPGVEDFQDYLLGVISEAAEVRLISYEPVEPTYRLHLGARLLNSSVNVSTDGDGWTSWGDAFGVDGNDASTKHYLWNEPVTITQADEIVNSLRRWLTPANNQRDNGVIAVVSNWDVWSENQDAHWFHAGPVLAYPTV